MLCPFCVQMVRAFKVLKEHLGAYLCPSCNEVVPVCYVCEYEKCPPVMVSTIGLRAHGKTVFLHLLFWVLRRAGLGDLWRDFYTACLNEDSLRHITANLRALESGTLPEATPKVLERPVLLRLHNVPHFPDRTLCVYDVGGEAFDDSQHFDKYVRFLTHARTALLLISLGDLPDTDKAIATTELLNRYYLGIKGLGANPKQQHLVVVLTKGDELLPSFSNGYSMLSDSLKKDSPENWARLDRYMGSLLPNSRAVRAFFRKELKAAEFTNFAEHNFRAVDYSVISALGARPSGQTLAVAPSSRRILDPLLLAMWRQLGPWKQRLHPIAGRLA